jgi:hypothetical protein
MKKALKITLWSLACIVGLLAVTLVIKVRNQIRNYERSDIRKTLLDGAAEKLRQATAYDTITVAGFPAVKYADPLSDPEIARVKEYFKIDEIAGTGDEVSRMKNIMTWVNKNVKYDGSKAYDGERNSIALYEYDRQTHNGLNCRMVATLANELYLAAGFKARFVTCMPADTLWQEAHVINAVWSHDKAKWLWMDSAFGAFVTDEQGELLSVPEVRDRIIREEPMIINEGEKTVSGIERAYYIDKYMAKNLFWFGIQAEYRFNTESIRPRVGGMMLTPPGFEVWSSQAQWYEYVTHNLDQFWQAPQ